jgi:hypothetical protein
MARHKADVADDEFEIFASYHSTGDGRYIGGLKVIRKADRRILFPFDGAPQIGPLRQRGWSTPRRGGVRPLDRCGRPRRAGTMNRRVEGVQGMPPSDGEIVLPRVGSSDCLSGMVGFTETGGWRG